MNVAELQERVDRLTATSRQRWLLGVTAVVAATAGAVAAEIASDRHMIAMIVFVAAAAAVAATHPDSHAALMVIGVVAIRWLVVVDDVTTPWSVVTALGLFAFHTLVALMAVTPPSATVDGRLLRRWLRRSAWVVAATVAVWALAAVVHRQQWGGDVVLTFGALAGVTVAVALVLARSLHDRTSST